MINQYYGFVRTPFSQNITEKEAFNSKNFQNLRFRFKYFLEEGGFFLLTGPIGSGKSTAQRFFTTSLNPKTHHFIYLNTAFDKKQDFYRTILTEFHKKPAYHAGECRNMLKDILRESTLIKKNIPIIIFDEAQNLPGFLMEEIRLLSNFDFDTKPIVYFILSEHKLLQQRFANLENEALRQRITVKFNLEGFSLEETCGYISHQFKIAESTVSIFTDSVISKIYDESKGIPRMINHICSILLLAAMINEKKIVDDLIFEQARPEW